MPITTEQIKELMAKATPGKWGYRLFDYGDEWWFGGSYEKRKNGVEVGGEIDVEFEDGKTFPLPRNNKMESRAAFIAALPDIAQLCLDQAEEIERLKLTIRGKTFTE